MRWIEFWHRSPVKVRVPILIPVSEEPITETLVLDLPQDLTRNDEMRHISLLVLCARAEILVDGQQHLQLSEDHHMFIEEDWNGKPSTCTPLHYELLAGYHLFLLAANSRQCRESSWPYRLDNSPLVLTLRTPPSCVIELGTRLALRLENAIRMYVLSDTALDITAIRQPEDHY